ncbi:MAG: hypothetical protein ACT4PV_11770 [Planctomycetaceae bacterium]
MRRAVLVGTLWAASLVLAWLLGAGLGRQEPGRAARATPPPPPSPEVPPQDGARPDEAVRTRAPPDTATAPEPAERDAAPEVPFTIEGVETVKDLSSRLMAYAARKLAQGPAGHRELYKTLDGLHRSEEARRLLKDETQLASLAYPWMKFLMDRDRQVVAMMETLYRTAAEEPSWFEGTDDETLEPFTEGLAMLLPSMVDEATLARFRGYVTTILATPQEQLPEALRKELRRFAEGLQFWAGPLTAEQLGEKLRDPAAPLAERLELLGRATPEALRGVDALSILLPAVSDGNTRALSSLGRVPLTPGELGALDRAFLAAVGQGRFNPYYLRVYLQGTRRATWADARLFVDEGMNRGGATAEAFAQALPMLPERPDPDYVRALLTRVAVTEATRTLLRTAFKLE